MGRLVLLAALLAGCVTPEERSPSWTYLHTAIIAPSCATASCHSNISSVAGMDLSEPHTAYAALTGRTCGAPPHPGDVELGYVAARFLGALRGTFDAGDSGEVRYVLMPPDQPLPGVEIELVERWYQAGAPCD